MKQVNEYTTHVVLDISGLVQPAHHDLRLELLASRASYVLNAKRMLLCRTVVEYVRKDTR